MAAKKRKSDEGDGRESTKKTATSEHPAPSRRITRTMTVDGPRQAVFNTAELLEAIVVCLPIKQVFAVQRVSRQFRDIVTTSVAIQEKLFLRIRNNSQKELHIRRNASRQYPYYTYDLLPVSKTAPGEIRNLYKVADFAHLCPMMGLGPPSLIPGNPTSGSLLKLDMTRLVQHPGSWRAISLTDPPCHHVRLLTWVHVKDKRVSSMFASCTLQTPSAVTLGAIFDAAMGSTDEDDEYAEDAGLGYSVADIISPGLPVKQGKRETRRVKRLDVEIRLPSIFIPTAQQCEDISSMTWDS